MALRDFAAALPVQGPSALVSAHLTLFASGLVGLAIANITYVQ